MNKNGFTILEVLFGIIVFMIGLLGVAALQISAIKGNDFSARAGEATLLAANQMERLTAMDFDTLVALDVDGDGKLDVAANGPDYGLSDMVNPDGQSGATGTNGRYNVMFNVAPNTSALVTTDFARLRVIVSWGDQDAAARSVSIAGVRAD